MEWLYFHLIKVKDGYIIFDIKYSDVLKDGGNPVVVQSVEEAEQYLSDNNIRGNVRLVVDPSV